jgi:phosphohistidine swiveling domain-containing protein
MTSPINFSGRCASSGVGRGNAVVVTDSITADSFGSGPVVAILPSLVRENVMLLPDTVVAVVAVSGSVGAHGAGLLRERRIPCIVQCSPEVLAIPKGSALLVEASKGVVRESPAESSLGHDFGKIKLTPEACYRPERRYQRLRFDLLKLGWEESPAFLFGLVPCEVELRDGVIFVHNGPDLDELAPAILNNVSWFLSTIDKRQSEITAIKSALRRLQEQQVSQEMLVDELPLLSQLYFNLTKYIYLTQFIADPLVEEWLEYLDKSSINAQDYAFNFLHSEYNRMALIDDSYPGKSTTWSLPSPPPRVWQGQVVLHHHNHLDRNHLAEALEASLRLKADVITPLSRYRIVVPLIYQLTEEHYFVSSSICSFINSALDALSKRIFGETTPASERERIYDCSMTDLEPYLKTGWHHMFEEVR